MVSSPSFTRNRASTDHHGGSTASHESQRAHDAYAEPLSRAQIKRATRTRLIWALLSSLALLISLIFLILVEVGNTSVGSVKNKIYFLNLNLSNIVPSSVPNAVLINNVAQTIGLHDFYTVGLWGFCEGNFGQGVTSCSPPKTLYWFNPVEILVNQLLSGSSIALPSQVTTYLHILKIASQWMFGLFLTGACLTFVLIFLSVLSLYSRWIALLIGLLTLLNALFVTVATVLGTAIFVILEVAFESVDQLNIQANIGGRMFAFMWIATVCSIIALLIQMGMCCCCASRRDLRKGKKGRKQPKPSGQSESQAQMSEKPRRSIFGRRNHQT